MIIDIGGAEFRLQWGLVEGLTGTIICLAPCSEIEWQGYQAQLKAFIEKHSDRYTRAFIGAA